MIKMLANALATALGSVFLLAALAAAADEGAGQPDQRVYRATVDAAYEDVVDDVKFSISEHNFRITGGNEIGGAIARRHDILFPRSEIVHFCNLEYARKFVEAAPEFLLHMPCKVAVYERDGQVVIETRMLPEDDPRVEDLTGEVNDILRAIVDFAAE